MREPIRVIRPGLAMAVLVFLLIPERVLACPVCYGASDSNMIAGVNLAILALLGITGGVLTGFASFFLYIRKRARMTLNDSADLPGKK